MSNSIKNESLQGSLSISRDLTVGGEMKIRGGASFDHDVVIKGWLKAANIIGECKGLFASENALKTAYPKPASGWYAFVGDTLPADVYRAEDGQWVNTGEKGGETNVYLDGIVSKIEDVEIALAEIGESITALTPDTVDISDGFTALNPIYGSRKAGIYQLIFAGNNAGWMIVGGDGTFMMTTQTVIGKFAATDGTLGFANTGKSTVLTRYMNTMPGDEQQLGWTEWHDLGAEAGGGTSPAYPAIARWSGETVAGVAVQAVSLQGVEGTVVWDTTRRTFLLRVATTLPVKYYNNWDGREDFQGNAWTSASNFVAGLHPNVYYQGDDGSVWVATSNAELARLFFTPSGGSQTMEVDDELSETSENPVQNRVITDAIKDITSWNEADNGHGMD